MNNSDHTQQTTTKNPKSEKTYAVGRNPYPEDMEAHEKVEVISFDEMEEKFKELEGFKDSGIDSVYRSDQTEALTKLRKIGFEPLAWTPNVRHHYYNEEADLLVKDIEGDLFIIENPTEKTLEQELQAYPKAEVSHGEKYDSRFDDSKVVLGDRPQDKRDKLKEVLDEAVEEFEKEHGIELKGTGVREYRESERHYSEEFRAPELIQSQAHIKGLDFKTAGRVNVSISGNQEIVDKSDISVHLMFTTTINQSGETETLGESKAIQGEFNFENQEWENLRFDRI